MYLFNELYINSNGPSGEVAYSGPPSWVYYLIGSLFLVLFLISAYFTFRWRHSKSQNEHIIHIFGEVKAFWIKNRFLIMMMISIVILITGIFFMLMNTIILTGS